MATTKGKKKIKNTAPKPKFVPPVNFGKGKFDRKPNFKGFNKTGFSRTQHKG